MKKGFSIFLPMVTIISFLMLVYAAFLFTVEKPPTLSGTIGDSQLKLLDRYQKGEKVQLYIDYSARLSAYKALIDFADYGGLNYEDCYDHKSDYSIWNSSCNPSENIEDNFFSLFTPYFNEYLDDYEVYLPDAYDFSLTLNKNSFDITGYALEDASLDVGLKEEKSQFKPKIQPEEVPYIPTKEEKVTPEASKEELPLPPKVEEKPERVKPSEIVPKQVNLDVVISEAASKNNINKVIIRSMIFQESSFRVNAVSPVGAAGLMQLMPHTAMRLGLRNIYRGDEFSWMYKSFLKKEITLDEFKAYEKKYASDLRSIIAGRTKEAIAKIDDRFDPEKNINAGTTYFTKLLKLYDSDLRLALAAYNAGPGFVDRNCKKGYNECVFGSNKETPNFVSSIVRNIESGGSSITTAATVTVPVETNVNFNKVLNYNIILTYYIRGSFKQRINYYLSEYKKVYEEATNKENLQCLRGIETDLVNRKTNELLNCIKDKHNLLWNVKKEGNKVLFDVATNQKIVSTSNELKSPVIKFAVNLVDFP